MIYQIISKNRLLKNKQKGRRLKIRKIILITGTPGVGKTTISRKLASELNANYVNITELVKEKNIETTRDHERDTLIVDAKKISGLLSRILEKKDGPFIIDGHYATDVLSEKDVEIVFVLRRNPRELKEVLQKRGYPLKKIWENVDAEILDICLSDALSAMNSTKVCEIDVSGKKIEMIIEEIMEIINKKKNCDYGKVDWLGKLEAEGQLEDFLKNIRLAEQT
jgi:adenylate kinase